MNAFDATQPTIDTMDESVSVSNGRPHSGKHAANRPLRSRALEIAKPEGGLSDALQRDDRQMLPATAMFDDEFDHGTSAGPDFDRVALPESGVSL